jgi:hypothetical protein
VVRGEAVEGHHLGPLGSLDGEGRGARFSGMTVSSGRGETDGEDDADRWGQLGRGIEEERGLRGGGGGIGLAGPGSAQCYLFSFFCSKTFPIFYFMICFITLTFGYQMHSNKFLKFCKIQHYILK